MQDPKELITTSLRQWQEKNSLTGEFDVEIIQNQKFGDFSTNIAMVSKGIEGGQNPRQLAEKIVEELKDAEELKEIIEKIEVAGPGFINFYLSSQYLSQMLQEVVQQHSPFGKSNKKEGPATESRGKQKIIVEYSSPNIAKPFTVGHLRSTIIGDAIANLLESQGTTIFRDNHLGDWGTQFGKQIYAIKTWGNEEEIEKADNPVKELVALYIKFHEEAEKDPSIEDTAREWFVKLEQGDAEAKRLWQKCIDWSFKEFDRLYSILGVTFTENDGRGYGESYFEDKMEAVISELREKGLLKNSEGAELVFFPEDKLPPLMILKKDGSTLYATRDLATDKFRLEKYGKDITIINEVGMEQELYFRQLFEVERMLGWVKDSQRIHKKHGHFRFADGKMSTRKGNVIWLDDVISEAISRAKALGKDGDEVESDEPTVTKIAIGALKWNDLRRGSEQDVTFDWDEILNMQGNSGPYVQYAYVRTQSVLSKAEQNQELRSKNHESLELESEEQELLRFLSQYPYHVEASAKEFAPNLLCNYLFELSQKFNLFYQKCKIIGSEEEAFRLGLTKAVGNVLKNGLSLLGIQTVEKM